jgi:Xaa-Pro dipeptidase
MLRISRQEHRARLERLEAAVVRSDLDVFLVSSFESIYYLTGAGFEPLERPFFLAVYPDGARDRTLLLPRLDLDHVGKKARDLAQVRSYWEYPAAEGRGWLDGLQPLLRGTRRVGVEPSLSCAMAGQVRELTQEVVPSPLVESLRLVKSADEVAMIRRAAGFADQGVGQLIDAAYFGATVAEGFARSGSLMRTIIREVPDWDVLTTRVLMATWAAPRSAQPHSIPDLDDRLREGPHVALSFLKVNGYAAESERTFFTSPPSPDARRAFTAVERARDIALRMIRPGLPCAELDASVSEFLRGEGYSGEECRLHRTGHGIGLGNHEAPWIAEGSPDILAEGMVVSIEPGIYLETGSGGGFRHSDTVLITRDSCELLTQFPRDLRSLTIRSGKPLRRWQGAIVRQALGLKARASRRAAEVAELVFPPAEPARSPRSSSPG